jgi:predicted nucleic acid-binding protein
MLVVSNTSPLIALAKINQLIIFQALFKKVMIPQAVYDEFLQNCTNSREPL